MSEKEWYRLLLEDTYTTEMIGEERERKYIPCRVERASPAADWESCWRLARLSGLGPENTTFLFKLIHQILPTQERISRTKPNSSPNCKGQGCEGEVESNEHALISCQANNGAGTKLLEFLQSLIPGLEVDKLLRLELVVEQDLELPVVWFISTVFNTMWDQRLTNKKVELYLVRAQLEAKINLLRETRFNNSVPRLDEFTAAMFS